MKTSEDQKKITKYNESLVLVVYADPATGGAPYTGGWGHTGKGMVKGARVSAAQANEWFEQDIAIAESYVNRLVKCSLSQGQYDALVDMVFNMGTSFMAPDNVVGDFDDLVSSCNLPAIRAAIPSFRRGNGKIMPGLVKRRAMNVARWDGFPADQCIAIGEAKLKEWRTAGGK